MAECGKGPEDEHPIVTLARRAVEVYVLRGEVLKVEEPGAEMADQAGVFVSIKKRGELRGCIGTFEPTRANIAREIVANAISSATRDPRFPSIQVDELSWLEYSVDVLTPPEPVDSVAELDPRRYGVIVVKGGRRGLLLPDLEGVDTAEQQVSIACLKAGIFPPETAELLRFEVRRYR